MLPSLPISPLYLVSLACAGTLVSGGVAFFLLARLGFRGAWIEFRSLRQRRLARAVGLLSPELRSARLDPFRHLPQELATLLPQTLRFEPLGRHEPPGSDSLLRAIHEWEDHHHSVSMSFFEAVGHVARHRLVPHSEFPELRCEGEPIGVTLELLIQECPEPLLQKELRMAHAGLKTGAEQNLSTFPDGCVRPRMRATSRFTRSWDLLKGVWGCFVGR